VSDVVDLRPLRLFGAKTFVERAVCGARRNVMNRASKNVHYNRGIRSVNSLFGFYFPQRKSEFRTAMSSTKPASFDI
jgi:hypothetical protein